LPRVGDYRPDFPGWSDELPSEKIANVDRLRVAGDRPSSVDR
jgi:hypothetical protein